MLMTLQKVHCDVQEASSYIFRTVRQPHTCGSCGNKGSSINPIVLFVTHIPVIRTGRQPPTESR